MMKACLLAVLALLPSLHAADHPWVSLFNGKDLAGWTPKISGHPLGENSHDTFRVEDGIIKVSYDKYGKFENQYGHLYSNLAYSCYILRGEMFGPGTLIVRGSLEEIEAAIPELEGQLTATVHGTAEELAAHGSLVAALAGRSGRLIFNGFPTGVEVCHSMVHGGPFPATSDGRSTSVGTMAIHRFTRAVAWQGFPDACLPAELQEGNPLGIRRLVDGQFA